ncbi:MAG: nuclear transport factor 2 family protein [Microbacterium sp.]
MGHPTAEQDREEILRVSKIWSDANVGLDIDALDEVFPVGDNFVMFNLDSFAYFGIDELKELWRYLKVTFPPRSIQTSRVMKMEVSGDMAWIISETTTIKGGQPTASRNTEVFQRDDGAGNRVWRMWHFHCSALQFDFSDRPVFTDDVPRRHFGDTLADRGLGTIPGKEPVVEWVTRLEDQKHLS